MMFEQGTDEISGDGGEASGIPKSAIARSNS